VTRTIAVVTMALTMAVCALLGAGNATAQSDAVTMSATVNGQDVATASGAEPLRLQPDGWADVAVTLTNGGDEAVDVRRVNLSGRVLGLTFFSFATTVDLVIEPRATDTVRYRLDLTDLDGQATGLMGGDLVVTDADRNTIAELSTVTDVQGSLMSVYGLFGIAIAVLTALAVLDTALALAKNRLSMNRWQRGLRFLGPGVGIGLVLVFSASVARLWVPDLGLWLVVAGLTAAVSFALGYFSPTPVDDDDDDFDDEPDDEAPKGGDSFYGDDPTEALFANDATVTHMSATTDAETTHVPVTASGDATHLTGVRPEPEAGGT
jgi:hypothetical protein